MKKERFRSRITPKYKPKAWKKYLNAGCYPYALDWKVNRFYLVGELIGEKCDCYVSDEYLIRVLIQELKLVFRYEAELVDAEYKCKADEKKIFLQRHNQTGYYHFYREDDNGEWSNKFLNELPVKINSIRKILKDPYTSGWCFLLKKMTLL